MSENHQCSQDVDSMVSRKLLDSRVIMLSGTIHDESAHRIVGQLWMLNEASPDIPITMVVNSHGGSVTSGFAIFDTMRAISAPVITVGTGIVASMGVTVLLAPPRERRFATSNTRFMIHQPLLSGTVFEPASDVEIRAREMVKTRDVLNVLIADATGQPLDKVERDTQRDFWMSTVEAREYGVIGKVLTSLKDLR